MRIACSLVLLVGGMVVSVQKEEQVVLDLGIAFLQASAMGIGRLAGETAGHTPLEITAVLILQRSGGQGVTAFVNGKRAQQQGLHPGRKHSISRVDGKLTIPQLMGQTDLPVLSGVVVLGTREIRRPRSSADAHPGPLGSPRGPGWDG